MEYKYKAYVGLTLICESTSLDGAIFGLWNVGGYALGKVVYDNTIITIYKGNPINPKVWGGK